MVPQDWIRLQIPEKTNHELGPKKISEEEVSLMEGSIVIWELCLHVGGSGVVWGIPSAPTQMLFPPSSPGPEGLWGLESPHASDPSMPVPCPLPHPQC